MRYHIHSLLTSIYERDSRGRVLSYDRIVDGNFLSSVRYEYDKLGQLAGKYAYGADASSQVLSQSYAYSIQGWMKKNSVRASYGSIFDESLVRDSEGRDALFSGRIRSSEYRHLDDLQMRDEYCYDHLGRLTGSMHFEDGRILRRGIESDIRYDANGNITSLVRFNEREEAEPRRFDYIGNRRVECQYDRNGNIISFGNVNILNLPYEQGLNIYKYLADGMKFEKRDTSGKGLRYSVAEEAILFQSDYSPYGRRVVTVRRDDTESNRYGFGGKESSIEGNPDVFLDFGARYWSPVFYTWLSRDPKADSYCSVSPYVYCAGDPVNFVDPDGKRPIYNKYGDFVGVTESGMQGLPFVIPEYKEFRRLTDDEAELEDVGTKGFINKESFERFLGSYMDLKYRPDWDGYITLREANEWYRTGNGQRLYADLNKVDFSGLGHAGKVGEKEVLNLFKYSFSPNDMAVHGQITVIWYPNNEIRALSDTYNFNIQKGSDLKTRVRNALTRIGKFVAGEGTDYDIIIYGRKIIH